MLRQSGKLAESLPLLEQAARLAPKNIYIQHDLGLALLSLGKPAQALRHFDRAVALDPKFGHAHLRRGIALEALSRTGAEDAYRQAIVTTPELSDAYARLASLRHMAARRDDAVMLYRAAASRTTDKRAGGIYLTRAAILENDLDAAELLLLQVLAIDPHSHRALGLMGYVLSARGDFTGAEASLVEALRMRPSQIGLYYDLVHTRKIRADNTALIDRMRIALSFDASAHAKVRLHLALAKALDDIEDYQGAASELEAASALQGRHFPIDRKGLVDQVDRLISLFSPEWLGRADHHRDPSGRPILVVGMPRSGTTLVERILSSHPFVAGGGEIFFWPTEGQQFLRSPRFEAMDMRQTAATYLTRLQSVSATAAHVVDKNPFNFIWSGLIHLSFPNARIVHCRRHPADTCLSAMLANLPPQPMFSNTLDDLLFFYRQYLRVMSHYRSVLPADRFLDLDYENLVEDPSTEIHKLTDFCGLPWDDACLTPEQNDQAVLTASVWQARQPIYRSSTGRRRRYEVLLRPFESLAGEE
jgi:Flp pilus assembly protein TadD